MVYDSVTEKDIKRGQGDIISLSIERGRKEGAQRECGVVWCGFDQRVG